MECSECSVRFFDFKQYIIHKEYVHNMNDNYTCPLADCRRTYHRKNSLKQHLYSAHESIFKIDQNYSIEKNINHSKTSTCPETVNVRLQENVCYASPETSSNELSIEEPTINQFLSDFQSTLTAMIEQLIAKLYSKLEINRCILQEVIKWISVFFSEFITKFDELISYLFKISDPTSLNNFNKTLVFLKKSFNVFDTEYKRFKYFKNTSNFLIPKKIFLGVSEDTRRKNDEVSMELKHRYSYYVPLGDTLKAFLELPNVYNDIMKYQRDLKNQFLLDKVYRNIIHGSVWTSKPDSNILPLILYCDDFESGNPLGSHAGNYKMSALYCYIATIPPDHASKLENVFITTVLHSNDRVKFGNSASYQVVIEDLTALENEGITIAINNTQINVKFALAALAGDNLGVHGMLGFVESFSATYFCRFCVLPKQETARITYEMEDYLRKRQDYEGHYNEKLGIKEKCIWHALPDFHVYKNVTCDVMHDLCEGVHRYSMPLIINYFIKNNFFTLENLNDRIKYFTYDDFEKNIPPPVSKQHLTNGVIVFSATEMLCFVRNFRFIIGEFIPEGDAVWQYYLVLLEITEILLSQAISQPLLENLKTLLIEHHEMFIDLFKIDLKPKYHILSHYATIIKKIGPPIFVSSFKGEAKHRDLKSVAQSIRSRKNLPLSIVTKCQLKSCYRYFSKEGLLDDISFSDLDESDDATYLKEDFEVTWYQINGTKYKVNKILLYKYEDDLPIFIKIKKIYVARNILKLTHFECLLLKTIGFNTHFRAYQITEEIPHKYFISEIDNFFSVTPTILYQINDEQYAIIPR